jgi:hypothetical protein
LQTSSADNFLVGLRDSLTGLAVDYARSRLIDVERADDDRNIPDRVDLQQGVGAGSGMSVVTVVAIVAAVVVGGLLLKRVL